ncbi:MAG: hypothetical protein M1814_000193 [Vezdaea aestivalis]|nr:MAG: hypothetical protein M1814_000193 [Vezdaea aestivalis]
MTEKQGWRVVVGCDEGGLQYKQEIVAKLLKRKDVAEVSDVGTKESSDKKPYPHIAIDAAQQVTEGLCDRAILICGTGMGMSITANKVWSVRAVTAHDSYSVERAVLSNNAQVLCLGQRVIGLELAKRLADEFLNYRFDETSASAAKVAVISEFEQAGRAAIIKDHKSQK